MIRKIILSVLILTAIITAIYFYYGRVQTFDPKLQKQIEANIPECVERDKAGEVMKKKMKEQNRTYYYGEELEDYDKKANDCFNKFVKKIHENKQI
ncbi:MAG TPA: hypothetical protein VK974_00330 [Methylophilaceae bacterium]|nr:hypothetical protein [Methylophilaceae bacterium]